MKTSILSLVGQFGNFVFSVFTLAENILPASGHLVASAAFSGKSDTKSIGHHSFVRDDTRIGQRRGRGSCHYLKSMLHKL